MKNKFSKLFASVAAVMMAFTPAALGGDHAAMDKKADVKVGTIVDVAAGAGKFGTLVAAIKAGDLVETLNGDGPFTVFAPNDEAFAKLPEGTLESLLKPENKDKLVGILKYHVVPGRHAADDVAKQEAFKTANGADLGVTSGDKGVHVGSGKVIATNIKASNGIIHVIDTVIMPPEKSEK